MSNFLKPIKNLPVAESVSEGDKILINSGGVAKQIDASLVGGGGGMTVIYAKPADDNGVTVMAYKDADYTQQMTYAEGKKAFENGAIAILTEGGVNLPLTVTGLTTTAGSTEADGNTFEAGHIYTIDLTFVQNNIKAQDGICVLVTVKVVPWVVDVRYPIYG